MWQPPYGQPGYNYNANPLYQQIPATPVQAPVSGIPTEVVDWEQVSNLDPDLIVRTGDITQLQPFISKFVGANFSQYESTILSHPLAIRLCCILQVSLKYMSEVQKQQANEIHVKDKQIQKKDHEIKKLKTAYLKADEILKKKMKSSEKCPICFKKFQNMDFLDNHVERRHPEHKNEWLSIRNKKPAGVVVQKDDIDKLMQQIAALQNTKHNEFHYQEPPRRTVPTSAQKPKSKPKPKQHTQQKNRREIRQEIYEKQNELMETARIEEELSMTHRDDIKNELSAAVDELNSSMIAWKESKKKPSKPTKKVEHHDDGLSDMFDRQDPDEMQASINLSDSFTITKPQQPNLFQNAALKASNFPIQQMEIPSPPANQLHKHPKKKVNFEKPKKEAKKPKAKPDIILQAQQFLNKSPKPELTDSQLNRVVEVIQAKIQDQVNELNGKTSGTVSSVLRSQYNGPTSDYVAVNQDLVQQLNQECPIPERKPSFSNYGETVHTSSSSSSSSSSDKKPVDTLDLARPNTKRRKHFKSAGYKAPIQQPPPPPKQESSSSDEDVEEAETEVKQPHQEINIVSDSESESEIKDTPKQKQEQKSNNASDSGSYYSSSAEKQHENPTDIVANSTDINQSDSYSSSKASKKNITKQEIASPTPTEITVLTSQFPQPQESSQSYTYETVSSHPNIVESQDSLSKVAIPKQVQKPKQESISSVFNQKQDEEYSEYEEEEEVKEIEARPPTIKEIVTPLSEEEYGELEYEEEEEEEEDIDEIEPTVPKPMMKLLNVPSIQAATNSLNGTDSKLKAKPKLQQTFHESSPADEFAGFDREVSKRQSGSDQENDYSQFNNFDDDDDDDGHITNGDWQVSLDDVPYVDDDSDEPDTLN